MGARGSPTFANLVFQKPLVAEVQRILLIGEDHEVGGEVFACVM